MLPLLRNAKYGNAMPPLRATLFPFGHIIYNVKIMSSIHSEVRQGNVITHPVSHFDADSTYIPYLSSRLPISTEIHRIVAAVPEHVRRPPPGNARPAAEECAGIKKFGAHETRIHM
jgi:hypothetical protein